MIKLDSFKLKDFDRFISWIDNKELLITIAGTVFTFPLTADQLRTYLEDDKSYAFNVIDTSKNKIIGHAEIYISGEGMYKIDKLLIGDKADRGKGTGQQIIEQLLEYSFTKLDAEIVELNVYDWNIAGIKCYEKSGFIVNPDKTQSTPVDDKVWNAINMTIDKQQWEKNKTGAQL